jgi:hypothetical protein
MTGPCAIKIVTKTGGEESVFRGIGEAETSLTSGTVRCKQGDGIFWVRFEKGEVFVKRDGDYTLQLQFRENELTRGRIGLTGAEGEIEIFTDRVGYTLYERSLLLAIKYTLYFGAETQEMSLILSARSENYSEEK